MGWTVIERFVEGKIAGRMCEDMIVVTPNFGVVIDGASDATGAVFAGRSGGRFAAETIVAAIHELDAGCTAREFADQLTRSLAERLADEVGEIAADTRWPGATAVCLSFERNEVWRVGDCSFRVDDELHGGTMRVASAVHHYRAAFNTALLQSGVSRDVILSEDPGGVAARRLTDIQQHLSNEIGPWGYGVINGRRVPDEYLGVTPLHDSVGEVVLASDGYPRLEATLAESERELQTLLNADPCGIDELLGMGKSLRPGANSIDDRSFLRLCRDV